MTDTLLGIDIGSSSVKVSILDIATGKSISSATSPSTELPITALKAGWAEQHPDIWWEHLVKAVDQLHHAAPRALAGVKAVGIAYQMHGLVLVDEQLRALRPAIIWCDSRAVPYGEKAFSALGQERSLAEFGNSPGNFTASKLAWVREHEPEVYAKARYLLLPGDYIALRLSGVANSTPSGLSEGVLWNFAKNAPADEVCNALSISPHLIPPIVGSIGPQSTLSGESARELRLPEGTPITYRAGDQPNNALALNVLEPGEVAANAGTSAVVYGVSDSLGVDRQSRVNNFLHPTHSASSPRIGALLCVNGAGALYRWLKTHVAGGLEYQAMNTLAETSSIGAKGLSILPFGNGAERILGNKNVGVQMMGLELNIHTSGDLFRAAQEGIVFALKYGTEIMQGMGVSPKTIRAGNANLFKSELFATTFTQTIGAPLELLETDGAEGAARGAGIGAKIFTPRTAFNGLQRKGLIEPDVSNQQQYLDAYARWKERLVKLLRETE